MAITYSGPRQYELVHVSCLLPYFFFNDTATTEIYTLSLHDALPIAAVTVAGRCGMTALREALADYLRVRRRDRKSTRLNSSPVEISDAVFCLKKKKKKNSHYLFEKKKKKKNKTKKKT